MYTDVFIDPGILCFKLAPTMLLNLRIFVRVHSPISSTVPVLIISALFLLRIIIIIRMYFHGAYHTTMSLTHSYCHYHWQELLLKSLEQEERLGRTIPSPILHLGLKPTRGFWES